MEVRVLALVAVAVLFSGCSDQKQQTFSSVWGKGTKNRLVVASSDFISPKGLVSFHDIVTGAKIAEMPTHSDAFMRAPLGQFAFIINRMGADNVQVSTKETWNTYPECKVPALANPQDVAVISGSEIYVSVAVGKNLLKMNPMNCQVTDGPDFSAFADADGQPEMGYVTQQGDEIAVQLRRLDTKQVLQPPTDYSSIAVWNRKTNDVQEIKLARTNPVTEFKTGPDGALYVGSAGYLGRQSKLDGGIERIDLKNRSTRVIAQEIEFRGDIVDFEVVDENRTLVVVDYPLEAKSRVQVFDARTRTMTKMLLEGGAYDFPQIGIDRERGFLLVADRNKARAGIRVFDLKTLEEKKDAFVLTTMPPLHFEITD